MTVLITGGSGGLGRACAELMLQRGLPVALLDISAKVVHVASQFASSGAIVAGATSSLQSPAEVYDAWIALEEATGPIEYVLNCVGVSTPRKVLDISPEDWDSSLRNNLTCPFFVCQTAARIWVDRGKPGSIVNVASTAAFAAGMYEATSYGAAKAGLAGLTVHLAQKLGPHGIRVNAVAPGVFTSPMTAARLGDPGEVRKSSERVPLGRVGKPEEIAVTMVHLALDATYVTGVVLPIDGGLLTTL